MQIQHNLLYLLAAVDVMETESDILLLILSFSIDSELSILSTLSSTAISIVVAVPPPSEEDAVIGKSVEIVRPASCKGLAISFEATRVCKALYKYIISS